MQGAGAAKLVLLPPPEHSGVCIACTCRTLDHPPLDRRLGPGMRSVQVFCLLDPCTAFNLVSVLCPIIIDCPSMEIGLWLQRCAPGVSSLVVIFLLGISITRSLVGDAQDMMTNGTGLGRQQLTFSEGFFIFYTIFLHVVVSALPLRIFRGAMLATRQIQGALRVSQQESDQPEHPEGRSHQSSPSELIHVSIIPSYKESIETLQATLRVLASHRLARSSYDVRRSRSVQGSMWLLTRHRFSLPWKKEIQMQSRSLKH